MRPKDKGERARVPRPPTSVRHQLRIGGLPFSFRTAEFRSFLLVWEPFVPDAVLREVCDRAQVCARVMQITRGVMHASATASALARAATELAVRDVTLTEYPAVGEQDGQTMLYEDEYAHSTSDRQVGTIVCDALAQVSRAAFEGEAYLDLPDRFQDARMNARICAGAAHVCTTLLDQDRCTGHARRVRHVENYVPAALAAALLAEINERCSLMTAAADDLVAEDTKHCSKDLPTLRPELIKAGVAVRVRLEWPLRRQHNSAATAATQGGCMGGVEDAHAADAGPDGGGARRARNYSQPTVGQYVADACRPNDADVWVPIHAVPRAWLKVLACRNHAIRVRAVVVPHAQAVAPAASGLEPDIITTLPGAQLVALSFVADRLRLHPKCPATATRLIVLNSTLRRLMLKQYGCRGPEAYEKLVTPRLEQRPNGELHRMSRRVQAPAPGLSWTPEHVRVLLEMEKAEQTALDSRRANPYAEWSHDAGVGFRFMGAQNSGKMDVLRALVARRPSLSAPVPGGFEKDVHGPAEARAASNGSSCASPTTADVLSQLPYFKLPWQAGTLVVVKGDVERCLRVASIFSDTCTPADSARRKRKLAVVTITTTHDLNTPLSELVRADVVVARFAVVNGTEYAALANANLRLFLSLNAGRAERVRVNDVTRDALDSLGASFGSGTRECALPLASLANLEKNASREQMFEDDVPHIIRTVLAECSGAPAARMKHALARMKFPCIELLRWFRVVYYKAEICRELLLLSSHVRWVVDGHEEMFEEHPDAVSTAADYPSTVRRFFGTNHRIRPQCKNHASTLQDVTFKLGDATLDAKTLRDVMTREMHLHWRLMSEEHLSSHNSHHPTVNVSVLEAWSSVDASTIVLKGDDTMLQRVDVDVLDVVLHDVEAACMVLSQGSTEAVFSTPVHKSVITTRYHGDDVVNRQVIPMCKSMCVLAAEDVGAVADWAIGVPAFENLRALRDDGATLSSDLEALTATANTIRDLLAPGGGLAADASVAMLSRLCELRTNNHDDPDGMHTPPQLDAEVTTAIRDCERQGIHTLSVQLSEDEHGEHGRCKSEKHAGRRARRWRARKSAKPRVYLSPAQAQSLVQRANSCRSRLEASLAATRAALAEEERKRSAVLARATGVCAEISAEEADTCPICASAKSCVITRCLHAACAACMSMSIATNGTCPTCNADVEDSRLAYVARTAAQAASLYDTLHIPTAARAIYDWIVRNAASGAKCLVLCSHPLSVDTWLKKLHAQANGGASAAPWWVTYNGSIISKQQALCKLCSGASRVCIASRTRSYVGTVKFDKLLVVPPDLSCVVGATREDHVHNTKKNAIKAYSHFLACLRAHIAHPHGSGDNGRSTITFMRVLGSEENAYLCHLIAGKVQSSILHHLGDAHNVRPPSPDSDNVRLTVIPTSWRACRKKAVFKVRCEKTESAQFAIAVPIIKNLGTMKNVVYDRPDQARVSIHIRRVEAVRDVDERTAREAWDSDDENDDANDGEENDGEESDGEESDDEESDDEESDGEGTSDENDNILADCEQSQEGHGDDEDDDNDDDNDDNEEEEEEEEEEEQEQEQGDNELDEEDRVADENEYDNGAHFPAVPNTERQIGSCVPGANEQGTTAAYETASECASLGEEGTRTNVSRERGETSTSPVENASTLRTQAPRFASRTNVVQRTEASRTPVRIPLNVPDACEGHIEQEHKTNKCVTLDFSSERRRSTCPFTVVRRLAKESKKRRRTTPIAASSQSAARQLPLVFRMFGSDDNTVRFEVTTSSLRRHVHQRQGVRSQLEDSGALPEQHQNAEGARARSDDSTLPEQSQYDHIQTTGDDREDEDDDDEDDEFPGLSELLMLTAQQQQQQQQ